MGFSLLVHAQSKALLEWRRRNWRIGIVAVAGAEVFVEDIPVPKFAITSQIQLAAGKTTDGHANGFQIRAAINCALTARGERLYPIGMELFVSGNKFVKIRSCERSGHHGQAR